MLPCASRIRLHQIQGCSLDRLLCDGEEQNIQDQPSESTKQHLPDLEPHRYLSSQERSNLLSRFMLHIFMSRPTCLP